MRKLIRVTVVAGILAAMLPGSAGAGENIIKFFERNNDRYVTQGEWAVFLVKAIGKDSEAPATASQLDYIALLEKNRIQPLDGWSKSEFLTFGAKSRNRKTHCPFSSVAIRVTSTGGGG